MSTPLPGSRELYRAMTQSLNWPEPGATIAPAISPRRSFAARAWRWIVRILR